MRIPIYVRKAYPGEDRVFGFVAVSIKVSRYRVYGQFDAIIDTGSPRTIISPSDAMRLKIPFNKLSPSNPRELRVAGFVLPAFSMEDVLIGLRDENRAITRIERPLITVLRYQGQYRGEIKYVYSILGTDFLEDMNFTLHFTPHNRTAYLEDTS